MPRAPLTDAQKQVLRDRLARAREVKRNKPKPPPPDPNEEAPPTRAARSRASHSPLPPINPNLVHTLWTEQQWMEVEMDIARTRLALLKTDFEVGSRIAGQRSDSNDPHTYKCFVCHNPVPEGKWAWKNDYRDAHTGLFQTVVICNQTCHTVYANDVRLQNAMRDLVRGEVKAPTVEVVS